MANYQMYRIEKDGSKTVLARDLTEAQARKGAERATAASQSTFGYEEDGK